jgi:hypothetical protein
MNPDGKSNTVNGICALSCHIRVPGYNKGSEDLIRVAELWPKVIQAKASPDTVSNEGDGSTLITASVSDPDGDFDPEDPLNDSTIVVNLKPLHESLSDSQTMYDDGLTGGDAAVDGIYSFELNPVPMGTPMGDYELTITATDHASNTGTGVFTLSVSQPGFTIVDNPEADFGLCTWQCWVDADAAGDGKACYHAPNEGCTATWTPELDAAGNYNVYAWWPAYSNQASDAKFTVHYNGGVSDPIEVNQKVNGKQWNYLGNFAFAAGTSGYVVLSMLPTGMSLPMRSASSLAIPLHGME